MRLTETHLSAIAGKAPSDNMRSVIAGLARAAVGTGLNRPQRLAHFIGQLAHESAGFYYDREIFNPAKPTAAQARYDTRTDLGNTPERDGDGYLYRGRGPIQVTGKSNYAQFTAWARRMAADAPDFVANPDALNTDPWEGLSPIWYWSTRGLNDAADMNDIRAVTRRINGGYNGLADRERYYDRAALVLLGYGPGEVKLFQQASGLVADGKSGPKTRAALHKALCQAPFIEFGAAPAPRPSRTPVPPKSQPVAPAPSSPSMSPASPDEAAGAAGGIGGLIVAGALVVGVILFSILGG